ncbi:MAG: sulfatase-like hydrolase/transferase [Akkermansiaceae bacterium]
MKKPWKCMALALLSGASLFAAESTKPNVLLICVDDLKPAIGCYGDTFAKTPNIDALAKRSVVFERAYCNQAVCAPSRNALMTSLRPQTLGIYDLGTNFRKSRPEAVTVAQHFRASGYKAQSLGKIMHIGHGNGEDAASWDVPHFHAKTIQYSLKENQTPTREGALFDNKRPDQLPRGAATEMADVADDTYSDGQIAAEAIRRLQAAKSDKQPFFLAVGFLKPHLPFVAPKRYWDMHDAAKLPQPERLTPPDGAPSFAPQFGGELRNYADIPDGSKPLSAELTRHLIHGYYAATSYMDAQLGKVLDELKKLNLEKNTIVVLWGDHGWHLGDHGMWCKHTNYEQATRIPILVSAPGAKAARSQALIETVDLYPTLAELAGLPARDGLDGRSFAGVIRESSVKHREFVTHVYPRQNMIGRAVRDERYRLVEWKKPGAESTTAEYELYDYQTDPGETKNLAASQADVVKSLAVRILAMPEAKPQLKTTAAADASKRPVSQHDRTQMFARRDSNKDGNLTKEEFLTGQPDPKDAPARFTRFDQNKDGILSRDEFVQGGADRTKP